MRGFLELTIKYTIMKTFSARTRRLKAIKKNRLLWVGITIMTLFIIVALFAPLIARPQGRDPYQLPRDWGHILAKPGTENHILGTDSRGSDIFYGLIWGTRISLEYGLLICLLQTVLGTIVGLTSGYYGRWVDSVLMRLTDMFLPLPRLILAMALAAAFGISMTSIAMALILTGWTRPARIVRSAVVDIKNKQFIESARSIAASNTRIMVTYLLPNCLAPLLVQATMDLGTIILSISSLAFIGLAPSGIAEWGAMIAVAQDKLIGGYWWPAFFPGAAIYLFVMGANLVGDGLRDALDPSLY